jgi:hypothetical protein
LLDGRVLPEAVIEMPFPVDPGEHRAVIEAPGRAPLEERIVASEGERVDVVLRLGAEIPARAPVAESPPPPALGREPTVLPAPARVVDRAGEPPIAPQRDSSRGWLLAPAVAGGVALVAFGTAGVFYGLRASAIADLRAGCAGRPVCPDDLRSVRDRGHDDTVAGNVALSVGIAATAAAAISVVLLRPRRVGALGGVTVSARGSILLLEGAL